MATAELKDEAQIIVNHTTMCQIVDDFIDYKFRNMKTAQITQVDNQFVITLKEKETNKND